MFWFWTSWVNQQQQDFMANGTKGNALTGGLAASGCTAKIIL